MTSLVIVAFTPYVLRTVLKGGSRPLHDNSLTIEQALAPVDSLFSE